jgi:hypothetical protein
MHITPVSLILLLVILALVFGGRGGWYGAGFQPAYGYGGGGILLVILLLIVFGVL